MRGSTAAVAKESAARPPTSRSAGHGLGHRGGASVEERPGLRPVAIFDEIRRRHPETGAGVHRTLERRIRAWRALNGAEQDVIFRQEPFGQDLQHFPVMHLSRTSRL